MTQTHSTICHTVNEQIPFIALEGDGLVTQRLGHALMMMTADCLPVVLGNAESTEVANLHAGWRGLANGIIENTVAEMKSQPTWHGLGLRSAKLALKSVLKSELFSVINILNWHLLYCRSS